MRSATEVRAQFADADEATQQQIIKDLFGSYDKNVHDIMRQGLGVNALNELKFPGNDDGERHEDNYPCYDCGSTIMGHHTRLCELAEDWAVRDLPSLPNSQYWTGKIPKGLHPIAGLEDRGPTNEATDPKFVGFMNKALGDKVDPTKPATDTNMPDSYSNFGVMSFDNMPGYRPAFKFGMSVLQTMDPTTRQHFINAPDDDLIVYMLNIADKKGFMPKYFVEEDLDEVTQWFDEIFADPSLESWTDLLKSMSGKPGVAEGEVKPFVIPVDQTQGNYENMGYRKNPTDKFALIDHTFNKVILTTNDSKQAKKEAIEWAEYDDILVSVRNQQTNKIVFKVNGAADAEKYLDEDSLKEFAPIKPPTTTGGPKGPKDYGQPTSSRYLGGYKFVLGTTNNYILTAEVQKYGLEWDEDDNIWYLDSPGAVYIADATEGEIALPPAREQRYQIHDLVSDYLNARNSAELQRVAAYFGFSADGEMNEGMAQDEAEEFGGWRAEFVNQINFNTFEVKMINTRSKESGNFIVRPVDMISHGPTLAIETMDVHDLQTGRTESWTSDDPAPDGPIVYAISGMFYDNKQLQKKLWNIVDNHPGGEDHMPGLDQRRSIGQEVDADAYIDSQEKTQAAMIKMKKGLAERLLDELYPGDNGFGPFKVYVGNNFIEKFATFDEAKEEIEFLWNADPRSSNDDWKIIDGTGKTVWQHDPGAAYDEYRMRHKIQFNKPNDLKEFAPPGSNDGDPDEYEILRKLAAQWWHGTEQEMIGAEKTLATMGWEIGQVESGDEDAGVFVIAAGDTHGDTYTAFGHTELEQVYRGLHEDAAGVGVVASKKQKNDPRYKTSLTVDVHPDTPKKNMRALRLI
jgi:hypothetical protein